MTQINMVGGSSESDVADVAVRPVRCSPTPAVITLTAPAMCRMAWRNASAVSNLDGPKTLVMPLSAVWSLLRHPLEDTPLHHDYNGSS